MKKLLLFTVLAITTFIFLSCKQATTDSSSENISRTHYLVLTDYNDTYLDLYENTKDDINYTFDINLASYNGSKCRAKKTATFEWNTGILDSNETHSLKWSTVLNPEDNKEYGTSYIAYYKPEDNFNIKYLIPNTSYPINGKIIRIECGECTCSCGVNHTILNFITDIPSGDSTVWGSWYICKDAFELDRSITNFDTMLSGVSKYNKIERNQNLVNK